MKKTEFGYSAGEVCNRNDCAGIIKERPVENCSCHINPPCSSCTEPRGYCPVCDWDEREDIIVNDFVVNVDKKTGVYKSYEPRKLDPTKIDWHSFVHTHFTMKQEGVYPEGTTQEQVLEKVKGTFGGRFTRFGGGKFEYIAYTD